MIMENSSSSSYWRPTSFLDESQTKFIPYSTHRRLSTGNRSRTTSMEDGQSSLEFNGTHSHLVSSTVTSPIKRTTCSATDESHGCIEDMELVRPIDSSLTDVDFEENVDWKSNICSPSYERQRMKLFRDTWSILQSKKDTPDGDEEHFTFERIVRMVHRTFKAKLAVFTLVGPTEVTVIARAGTDIETVKRHQAFCGTTIEEFTPPLFIIHDALNDEKYKDHPFVVNEPNVRFYCGAPIYMHGFKIGTLSLADSKVRPDFGEEQKSQLQEFAGIIADILMEQRKKAMSIESDYAKITVGLFSHLKKPLLQVEEAFLEAHSAFLNEKEEDPLPSTKTECDPALISSTSESAMDRHTSLIFDLNSKAFKTAVSRLTDSIDNLNIVIENSLQLSLSLFNYLSPHEASELVPLVSVPSMVEDLIASVTNGKLPKGMKGPIEVILESSPSFPVEEDSLNAPLVSINLSMLWMILYSLLSCECKCKGSRLRVVMSLFPADPDFSPMFLADVENKRSVNAVLTMRFVFDPVIDLDMNMFSSNQMSRSRDVNDAVDAATNALRAATTSASVASIASSSSAAAHCEMDHALDYLLKSFGGRVVTFDPQVVHERRKSFSSTQSSPEKKKLSGRIASRSQSRSQSLSGKVVRIEIPCEVKTSLICLLSNDSPNGIRGSFSPKICSIGNNHASTCGLNKKLSIDMSKLPRHHNDQEKRDCVSPSLFASGRTPSKASFPIAKWMVSRASKTNARLAKYFVVENNAQKDSVPSHPLQLQCPSTKTCSLSASAECSADCNPRNTIVSKDGESLQSGDEVVSMLTKDNTSKTSNLTAMMMSPELSPRSQLALKQKPIASTSNSSSGGSRSLSWFRWLPSTPFTLLQSLVGSVTSSSSEGHIAANSRVKKSREEASIANTKSNKVIPALLENGLESPSKTPPLIDHHESATDNIDSYSNHMMGQQEAYRRRMEEQGIAFQQFPFREKNQS